ncbi:hypothetical protein Tco_0942840 [Tanacetum coccineum]
MSSGLSASMAEGSKEDDDEEDEEIEESMDSDSMSKDAKDEGPTAEDEDPAAEDKGLTAEVEGPGMDDEDYDLDDETHGRDDEGRALVVGTTVSAPLGIGYGALRHRELALEEGDVYSTFEVGQGSRSALESERPERVSAFRQPTLTTWTDPEDGMIYIDIPDYPPLAPPVQTPPSPEWTSGSLPISPSHSDVPSPISSPMIPLTIPSHVATPATVETEGFLTELGAQVEMQRGLIHDHAVRLEELSPALFQRSEVEEAVRMISSTYSSKPLSRNYKAKNSLNGSRFDNRAKCLIPVDALADNVDIWWARNKYPCVIVNESFIFVTHSLFPVRISKGMERRLGDRGGGGGGGVVGGVGIVYGDGVDRGVGGVDCGVVCGFVCGVVCGWSHGAERKDNFVKCNMTRNDDFVGVQVKAPVSTMIVSVPEKDRWCGARGKFVWWKGVRVEGRILMFELQRHQGDQDVDAKGNGY